MIIALDQLNGLVDTVDCETCNGKAAVVYLNDKPDMKDDKGKSILAKPPSTRNYIVICDQKAGTHTIHDTHLTFKERVNWAYKILIGRYKDPNA